VTAYWNPDQDRNADLWHALATFNPLAHPNILNFAITHSSAIAAADQNKDLAMANLRMPNPFNAHWSPIPLDRRYQVVTHRRDRCTDTGKAAGGDWDVHLS
jgi:hypothetical protein